MSTPELSAGRRKAALTFILITVALDILAFGIIIPVLPKLVVDFLGGDTSRGAQVYGLFGVVWALMQFVFSPILGAFSDRYGRRRVILISCLGLGLDFILMALAPTLGWLLLGRIISGITASSFSTAGAYIADITPPEKRAQSFGMMGVAFGLGFVVGPAVGGLLGAVDPRWPFWAAAALALTNTLYGFFVLPESLPPERRSPFSWRKANPLGSLRLLRSHHELFGLASISFLSQLAHVVLPSTAVLYMSYRYAWDTHQVGLTLALVGICSAIVQGGLTGRVVKRWGERPALLFSLAMGFAGFMIYGLAPSGAWFLLGIPVLALWGFANPAVMSLMTQRVAPHEQGQLQGANSALIGIAGMIGPALFTQSFAHAIARDASWHVPGAPFLLSSLLLGLAALIAWRAARRTHAAPVAS